MRILFILLFAFLGKFTLAQDSQTIKEYIDKYKSVAINEMIRTGIPAAIKLAQGIHETSAGRSDLVLRSNNHFGIKCKSNWTGESVTHTDDAPNECFRKYNCADDSYKDHSDFLKNGARYAFLFNLDPMDYEGWAYGLKKAGYATNSRYPAIIIKLIEDYKLQDYTLIAMGKLPQDKQEYYVNKDLPSFPEMNGEVVAEKKISLKPAISYPTSEFKINETRVIFASKNTPFLTLAQQHKISLKKIFEFNDDMPEEEVVPFDQLIYLQRKRKTGLNEFHIVQQGEDIYDIAQTEAIRLESLLELNMLTKEEDPAPGEKLYMHSKAPAMPKLLTSTINNIEMQNALAVAENGMADRYKISPSFGSSKTIIHIVQPREGLYAISSKYSVSVNEIRQWNELQSDDLKVGQQLKILK